jgi:hypothetical protein
MRHTRSHLKAGAQGAVAGGILGGSAGLGLATGHALAGQNPKLAARLIKGAVAGTTGGRCAGAFTKLQMKVAKKDLSKAFRSYAAPAVAPLTTTTVVGGALASRPIPKRKK